jgi:hypothetical protein
MGFLAMDTLKPNRDQRIMHHDLWNRSKLLTRIVGELNSIADVMRRKESSCDEVREAMDILTHCRNNIYQEMKK